MKQVVVDGELRRAVGKGPARRARASGRLPAVVYGRDEGATPITVDYRDFTKAVQGGLGGGTLIELVIADEGREGAKKSVTKTAILKDVQWDPVRGDIIHADFQAVSMTEAITTKVPVSLVGEERRANDGGVLQHMVWEVEVHALPGDIPERIEVDVSGLGIGDSIRIGDLGLPETVRIHAPEDETVVSVQAPTKPAAAEEVEAEAEAEGEAEPPAEAE